MEQLRALPSDAHGPGLYFLWLGDDLNYIGASREVSGRIYWHNKAWRFKSESYRVIVPHNRATVLACPVEELTDRETEYLVAYKPPFNKELYGKIHK